MAARVQATIRANRSSMRSSIDEPTASAGPDRPSLHVPTGKIAVLPEPTSPIGPAGTTGSSTSTATKPPPPTA